MLARICIWMFFMAPLLGMSQPQKCPKIPDSYQWNSARDYKREEELVYRTLTWLNATPLRSELEARSKASSFVMEWICGSPRIKLSIKTENLPFYSEYPDLLFPFIQGMAQCKLAKTNDCDELQSMVSGFSTVAFMIQSDSELKKAKPLQPIIKAHKKGKMQAYVESILSKSAHK